MSTNNKWGALSMRDRAFLIREAVRNGITDINSIRDTWEHRFDGESNQLTEDEYIAQRARTRISEALEHARNRKETVTPYIRKSEQYKKAEEEALNQTLEELNKLSQELAVLQADPSKGIRGKYNPTSKRIEYQPARTVSQVEKEIAYKESLLQTQLYHCNQDHIHGSGCLATVMDDYGKTETWNERFAKNPEKQGFKKINPEDIKEGDIVQFKNDGLPFHAMMANTNYQPEYSNMRFNGSNGEDIVRINSKYPSNYADIDAYRFVGDKADSLQWKKEYREKYGHQFSGKSIPYTTDSNNETDSSFIEKLAYNIGSVPSAKDAGEGDFGDILEGVFNAITNRDPYKYDDLKAFLGHPEDYGFKPSSDTRGPQFGDVISKYKNKNIKTYQGNINPFNEYVVTQEDYNKFFDMATKGEIFYSNADGEYFDYYYKGNPDNMLDKDTAHFLHTPYRNDSHDYPIEFVIKDGNLYANAADFYDFSANKGDGLKKRIQARLLTRYGKPYIVRQNMIPVRAIDLPEEFLGLPTLDYKGNSSNMDLTEEQKRARNMHRNLEVFESEK